MIESPSMNAEPMKIIRAACPHDCPDTCALLVSVDNEKVIKVAGAPDHPPTDGVLCTKVARYTERLYHPDRLLYPMKRVGRKGEGRFVRVGWDEALDAVAARLKAVALSDPQAILPYSYAGTMGYVQGEGMAARFFHRLGAALLDRTICSMAGFTGLKYTYGAGMGFDVDYAGEADLILIWGANPIVTGIHYWRKAQAARRRGARLICIDPHRSLTAEKCDQHIAILPGTDAALALGLMHVLMTEDLLDHDYIARHTLGFDALRQRAAEYPPARVAVLCGIAEQTVIELARAYGRAAVKEGKAVAIRAGYGMQRNHGGGQAARAIACLPSLVGAWRKRGGGLLLSSSGFFPVNLDRLQRPELMPTWPKKPRTINMSTIGNALLHSGGGDFGPAIEAVLVYNSNPLAVAPESAKVAAGFAREDLFTVVLEQFQTDTADYADILLPATMQMEHTDIHRTYGHTYIVANNPAVSAPGEALPNSEIFRRLAARMGFTEPCFSDNDDEVARSAFDFTDPRASHLNWEGLKEKGWGKLAFPEAPFAEGGFRTPSGKCEFFCDALGKQGFDPLPGHVPPHESMQSNPALGARYPLAMISSPARNFLNSSFANVDSLVRMEATPKLEIHPADAVARGIVDSQQVRAFNERGTLLLTAIVTDRVRQGLVVVPSLWWRKRAPDGKNANELTSQALSDLGSAPTFYDCLVEVVPALQVNAA
jgi:anaerobic selenocysteine-containing dehydrogenase